MKSLLAMKPLELMPIHFDYNDCLDDQLISVINYFRKDIQSDNLIWHLCGTWDFSFKSYIHNMTLGKVLNSNHYNEYNSYKKYYGVELSFHRNKTFNQFIGEATGELLLNKPVVLFQKSFWIPWDANYHVNQEYTHAYIIVGIDEDNETIIASDGYYLKQEVLIKYEEVKNGFVGEYITFNYIDQNSSIFKGLTSWKEALHQMLANVSKKDSQHDSMFIQMKTFAKTFKLLEDIKSENSVGSTNFVASDLYNALTSIVNSRKKIARFMKYLETKLDINQFSAFSVKFDLAATNWYRIQHMMLKSSISLDFSLIKHRISENICEVADLEENIAVEMRNFINSDLNYPTISNTRNLYNNYEKLSLLDLREYFNNKGFGELGLPRSASFLATGQYFSTQGLPQEDIWINSDMKFKFPNVYDDHFDNLYCNGQIIILDPDKYDYIMFLGCADVNNFSDELEIIYSDGSKEKIIISLSCWYVKAQFDDRIAWQGNLVEKRSDGTYMLSAHKYKIFSSKYPINNSKKYISAIRLPECSNMHLFAITMGIRGYKEASIYANH
ncbi:MAG: cysteine peptidase family C39 domain-containing protein [Ruminiclostridium sp.]